MAPKRSHKRKSAQPAAPAKRVHHDDEEEYDDDTFDPADVLGAPPPSAPPPAPPHAPAPAPVTLPPAPSTTQIMGGAPPPSHPPSPKPAPAPAPAPAPVNAPGPSADSSPTAVRAPEPAPTAVRAPEPAEPAPTAVRAPEPAELVQYPDYGIVMEERRHAPCFEVQVDRAHAVFATGPAAAQALWVVATVRTAEGGVLSTSDIVRGRAAGVCHPQARVGAGGRARFTDFLINLSSHGKLFTVTFAVVACATPGGPLEGGEREGVFTVYTLPAYSVCVTTSSANTRVEMAKRVWDPDMTIQPRATHTLSVVAVAHRLQVFAGTYMDATLRDMDISEIIELDPALSDEQVAKATVAYFDFKTHIFPAVHYIYTLARRDAFHRTLWRDGYLRVCSRAAAEAILALSRPGDFLMHFYPPSANKHGALGVTFVSDLAAGRRIFRHIRISRARMDRSAFIAEIIVRPSLQRIVFSSGNPGDPVTTHPKSSITDIPGAIPPNFDLTSIIVEDDIITIA